MIAAVVVDWFVDAADESFADSVAELALWSPSAAVTLLASIGRGMVTSTGFVFSVVLLIIQFGSASYSPRTVSYFLRSRVTQSILAVFVGTTSYAFLALISIGSAGRDTVCAVPRVLVCLLFLLASLVALLALIQNVAGRIRVDALLTDLGRVARRALSQRLPAGEMVNAAGLAADTDDGGAVVRHRGDPVRSSCATVPRRRPDSVPERAASSSAHRRGGTSSTCQSGRCSRRIRPRRR